MPGYHAAMATQRADNGLTALAGRAAAGFADAFGRAPTHLAAAPGRVNLIGEHTDYNAGRVMPMAIERWTVVAAGPREDSLVRLRTTADTEQPEAVFDINKPIVPGEPRWANYVRGAVAGWCEQAPLSQGFDALIDATVPLGGGLSSSASLTVACLTLLEALTGTAPAAPIDKARAAQRAENAFAGMPCGLMDPLASAAARPGQAMQIDFRDTSIQHVAMPDDLAAIITPCGKPHALVGGEYAARRRQCASAAQKLGVSDLSAADVALLRDKAEHLLPVERQRAMHVIEENARVQRFAEALKVRDWPALGQCIYDSHASMRDLFEITTPELDTLVDLASAIGPGGGVIGARMTGGGFGGSTMTLALAGQAPEVCEQLAAEYKQATGLTTRPFITRPAGGAQAIDPASMSRYT